ncbi:MAG: signal peptidase II [bacterium]
MQKRNKLILLSAIIVVLVVILDQISKYMIYSSMYPYEVKPIISNFFNIVYAKNYGSAFSFLNDAPAWFRKPFFIMVPLAAMVLVLYLLKNAMRLGKENILQVFAFSLVIGGALGNFLNRLTYGFVIDFLQFKITNTYYWPSFNVADISITVAVTLLFIEMTSVERKKRSDKKKKGSSKKA